MGKLSSGDDWRAVWGKVRLLSDRDRFAVGVHYGKHCKDVSKFNHEILQEALDRHLAKQDQPVLKQDQPVLVTDAGAQEYEEVMLSQEIMEREL